MLYDLVPKGLLSTDALNKVKLSFHSEFLCIVRIVYAAVIKTIKIITIALEFFLIRSMLFILNKTQYYRLENSKNKREGVYDGRKRI